jgi:hypothetical protein
MHNFSESTLVEQPTIGLFAQLGYGTAHAFAETFGKNGTLGRETNAEVALVPRLRAAALRGRKGRGQEGRPRPAGNLETRKTGAGLAQKAAGAHKGAYRRARDPR